MSKVKVKFIRDYKKFKKGSTATVTAGIAVYLKNQKAAVSVDADAKAEKEK